MVKILQLQRRKLLQIGILIGSFAILTFVTINVQAEENEQIIKVFSSGASVTHGNIEEDFIVYPVAGQTKEVVSVMAYKAYDTKGNIIEVEDNENLVITEKEYNMYVTNILNVRAYPDVNAVVVGKLLIGDEVTVVGEIEDNDFVCILYEDDIAYIHSDYLSNEVPTQNDIIVYQYSGAILNSLDGVVYGPSGKETYYNLDMSNIINNMQNNYSAGEYWVRSDGAKMLGDYIMVAADLNIHPRGSLVETSMGTGLVVDTGNFVNNDAYQIDIATTW